MPLKNVTTSLKNGISEQWVDPVGDCDFCRKRKLESALFLWELSSSQGNERRGYFCSIGHFWEDTGSETSRTSQDNQPTPAVVIEGTQYTMGTQRSLIFAPVVSEENTQKESDEAK